MRKENTTAKSDTAPMPKDTAPKTIATADCETDPFLKGRPVYPFVWGFFDGSTFQYFWGTDCNEQFVAHLKKIEEPLTIFAHNGGKFDWYFLADYLEGAVQMIGTRIVRGYIGIHEIRDSFANIPIPLKKFHTTTGEVKGEIDYEKVMSANARELPNNRRLILEYLKTDCTVLYDAMARYRVMFGDSLTMASASMKKLNEVETGEPKKKIYERLTARQDIDLRRFYFGGRVECFKEGIIEGHINMYDVNSMYPFCMEEYRHPVSSSFQRSIGGNLDVDKCDFATVTARSSGALPVRGKNGLRFPHAVGTFHATGAEIRMAMRLGLLELHEVHETITATHHVSFRKFVRKHWNLRLEARAVGDKMLEEFFKFILNGGYGKFCQNPQDFKDMIALPVGELPDGELFESPAIRALPDHEAQKSGLPCACDTCYRKRKAWSIHSRTEKIRIWQRPALNIKHSYLNVATGASITGYARAILMEGLANADDPIYCDTDCVITRGEFTAPVGRALGEWKHEASGDKIAVAGKKMYAFYDSGRLVKLASKGVRLSDQDIYDVALRREVTYEQPAPIFKITGQQKPLKRKIRNTAYTEIIP